jgi:hypothetical protein
VVKCIIVVVAMSMGQSEKDVLEWKRLHPPNPPSLGDFTVSYGRGEGVCPVCGSWTCFNLHVPRNLDKVLRGRGIYINYCNHCGSKLEVFEVIDGWQRHKNLGIRKGYRARVLRCNKILK